MTKGKREEVSGTAAYSFVRRPESPVAKTEIGLGLVGNSGAGAKKCVKITRERERERGLISDQLTIDERAKIALDRIRIIVS